MSDYLEEQLWIEILSRLPPKKLLQCTCVSKTWCSLISSPAFITHHLNRTTTPKPTGHLLLLRYCSKERDGDVFLTNEDRKERYLLYPDEYFPDYYIEEIECPFKSVCYFFCNIVGSCNGVLCLVDNGLSCTDRACLWNPSIRKTISIPRPLITFQKVGPFAQIFGFGFDSITDDYKLVRLVYAEGRGFGFDVVPPLVEVYSLRRGCWKRVTNDLKNVIMERSSSAFLNGACHWVADRSVIVSFSLRDEVFKTIAAPFSAVNNATVAVTCDGLLSLVPLNIFSSGIQNYSVWVMKEYGDAASWTKLFNIEHLEGVGRLLQFRRNGEVILITDRGLVGYDPKTKENWDCDIDSEGKFYLDTFVQSLVLLNEANGVSDEDVTGNAEDRVLSKDASENEDGATEGLSYLGGAEKEEMESEGGEVN